MDDLPVVVLREIFDFLSIREKFQVKLVCKKWMFAVETMSHQKSVCIYSNDYPYRESWCFSRQRVAEEDLLYLKFDYGNDRPFDLRMEFFRSLQKVYLSQIGNKVNLFLEDLNSLAKLKVLMVDDYIYGGPIRLRKLSSSSLEKLSLKYPRFDHLELDTPNLSSLAFWDHQIGTTGQVLDFRFPMKIKKLECFWFNSNLSRLKNLETLICQEITFDFKLDDFKSLTRLELFPRSEEQLQVARRIREERKRLKRNGPEMIVSGFKEDLVIFKQDSLFISPCFQLWPEYLEYALQNYANLEHIPWGFSSYQVVTLIRYTHLIPRDFFDKFSRIGISISDPDLKITESEQADLIELIRRSNPESLNIHGLGLSLKREFYEQVSFVRSIKCLCIGPHLENVEFDHFLKLKHLSDLHISFEKIPGWFVSKLFQQLRMLNNFRFASTSSKFKIVVFLLRYPPEELDLEPGEVVEPIYDFAYYSPTEYFSTIVSKYCWNLNELIQEINKMTQDETLKDYLTE